MKKVYGNYRKTIRERPPIPSPDYCYEDRMPNSGQSSKGDALLIALKLTWLAMAIMVLIAIGFAISARAEDRSGEWINLSETLVCDTPTVTDSGYTGITSLLDANMLRFDYAYKVDTVFTDDSLIVTWELCNSLDFSTTPTTTAWYDTITDMTTAWQWTGTDRELKNDSVTWGGYFRAKALYIIPNTDTLLLTNEYLFEVKTEVYLDIDD